MNPNSIKIIKIIKRKLKFLRGILTETEIGNNNARKINIRNKLSLDKMIIDTKIKAIEIMIIEIKETVNIINKGNIKHIKRVIISINKITNTNTNMIISIKDKEIWIGILIEIIKNMMKKINENSIKKGIKITIFDLKKIKIE